MAGDKFNWPAIGIATVVGLGVWHLLHLDGLHPTLTTYASLKYEFHSYIHDFDRWMHVHAGSPLHFEPALTEADDKRALLGVQVAKDTFYEDMAEHTPHEVDYYIRHVAGLENLSDSQIAAIREAGGWVDRNGHYHQLVQSHRGGFYSVEVSAERGAKFPRF